MAIQTTLKRSFILWNLLYFVLCAGLGLWGAYDYWVSIPNKVIAVAEFEALTTEQQVLKDRDDFWRLQEAPRSALSEEDRTRLDDLREQFRAAGTPVPSRLTEIDIVRNKEINATLLEEFDNEPPQPPASYDAWVNLYVYMIGCGVLGAPWFFWRLASRRGLSWTLEDDGSLVTPDGTYEGDRIVDIDMALWMRKSIARVKIEGVEDPIMLDDYEHQDTHLLVGALAHKFHPDEWTEDAKPVKKASEDADAESAEASDGGQADGGEADEDERTG